MFVSIHGRDSPVSNVISLAVSGGDIVVERRELPTVSSLL